MLADFSCRKKHKFAWLLVSLQKGLKKEWQFLAFLIRSEILLIHKLLDCLHSLFQVCSLSSIDQLIRKVVAILNGPRIWVTWPTRATQSTCWPFSPASNYNPCKCNEHIFFLCISNNVLQCIHQQTIVSKYNLHFLYHVLRQRNLWL